MADKALIAEAKKAIHDAFIAEIASRYGHLCSNIDGEPDKADEMVKHFVRGVGDAKMAYDKAISVIDGALADDGDKLRHTGTQ